MTDLAPDACPHRPPCPGCPRFGDTLYDPRKAEALRTLADETGATLHDPVAGEPFGYRVRARLAIRGRANSPKIGIFQEGSHRIVDIPTCAIHHPLVNEVAEQVKAAIRETRTPPFFEGPHLGLLRYMQVTIERTSGTAQVVIVANADTPDAVAPFLENLESRLGRRLQALFFNSQSDRSNAILGEHFEKWSGTDAIREDFAGASVFYPPAAFGQANLDLSEAIVRRIHSWIPDDLRIVEFHAGVGAIGLGLCTRAKHVTFNEAAPGSLAGLALGIAALDEATRTRVRVLHGPAGNHETAVANADVVIVDPPRKGLESALLDRFTHSPPPSLIAVACGFETFLTQSRRLLSGKRLALREIVPYLLFPQTDHVEVLARFERSA